MTGHGLAALLAPWHMGALHAYEQALVYLLAFAPPLLVAVVIWVRRRQDRDEEGDAE